MGAEKRFLEGEAQKVHFLPSREVGGTLNAEYLLFRLNALEKARELAAELRITEKYGCQTEFDNGGLEIDLPMSAENLGIFSKFARCSRCGGGAHPDPHQLHGGHFAHAHQPEQAKPRNAHGFWV